MPVATALGWRTSLNAILAWPSGRVGAGLIATVVLVSTLGPMMTAVNPFAITGAPLVAPSAEHLFGTDALGRDMFSALLSGGRTSLIGAFAVSALTFVCGMAVGLLSGFRGGWIDSAFTRLTELLQVLPRFFLVIVVVALFGPGLNHFIWTLGLTSWPTLARVVRGEVFSLRQSDFVLAVQASGATGNHIVWRTIAPNVLLSALVVTGLLFGQVLLVEASLGFLGLADPNVMSWGLLAGQAAPLLRVAWWLAFWPGVAIAMTVLGMNLLIDAFSAGRLMRQ